MTRLEAIRRLRTNRPIYSKVFNEEERYPFHVELYMFRGTVRSTLSYFVAGSQLELLPRQVLSFIKREFPR